MMMKFEESKILGISRYALVDLEDLLYEIGIGIEDNEEITEKSKITIDYEKKVLRVEVLNKAR